MQAVDIGIGHYYDFAVFELGNVKFLAYSGAERLNDRQELFVAVHLIYS